MPTIGRVVQIGTPARLSYKDLQLLVQREGEAEARVPLEDLAVLVCDYAATTFTEPLLAALAEANVAVVVCGPRHLPAGLLLPLAAAALHTRILRQQMAATEPRKKRIWQSIVIAKLQAQASVLEALRGHDHGLRLMAKKVGSGDPQNLEGRAARIYFPALFGQAFVRDPGRPGINAALNYTYALIRGAVARAVVGAGLHPALGVHHRNQYDAFTLADDAMEPLRPLADRHVLRVSEEHPLGEELTTGVRNQLLEVLTAEVTWDGKRYPLFTALEQYAACLRSCLAGEERKLRCPSL